MIYVDDAKIPAAVRNGSKIHTSEWSHLTADTIGELHRFAVRIGLRRSWFQDDGVHPHYDLTAGKRWQAIRAGAQQITWEQSAEISRRSGAMADVLAEIDPVGQAIVEVTNPVSTWPRPRRCRGCGEKYPSLPQETYTACLPCRISTAVARMNTIERAELAEWVHHNSIVMGRGRQLYAEFLAADAPKSGEVTR